MKDYIFESNFRVRDYECDMQGVVNNSIYMNYLEHARHLYLQHIGYDFAELTKAGILPMVYKAELEYKKSLRSGDAFTVKIRYQKEGHLKAVFYQDIYLKDTDTLILRGKITAVVLKNNRPISPDNYLK